MKPPEVPIRKLVVKCESWNPKTRTDQEFDYIDLSSVDKDNKSIVTIDRYACGDAPSRARQLVETDDVLVSTVRPNLNGVAMANGVHHGMTASTGFCILRPNPKQLDARYLFNWVKTDTFVQRMIDVATGANYPAISDSKVKSSTIPLPPIAEQKRIAGILDAADALRTKRRQSLAELDTLLQSVFIDMFGDPVTNPLVPIDEFCDLITDGTHQTPTYADDGYKFLSSKDVKTGTICWDKIKYIPHELHEQLYKRLAPQRNDILLAKNGTTGTAAIVDSDEIFDIYVSLALLRPKATTVSLFLLFAINTGYTKFQFDRSLKGVGVPNLHLKEIRKTLVPSASYKMQSRFAGIAQNIINHKISYNNHLRDMDTLFASLQHQAFNGEF
jgi:type I restriction enzyme, S subunit